jgi:hypothetical protein
LAQSEVAGEVVGQETDSDDTRQRLRDAHGRFAADPDAPAQENRFTDSDRRRAWREMVNDPDSPLTEDERAEVVERGYRGPQRINPWTDELETMELSHEPVPLRHGGTDVVPRWPDDHAAIDPDRKLAGNRRPNQPL